MNYIKQDRCTYHKYYIFYKFDNNENRQKVEVSEQKVEVFEQKVEVSEQKVEVFAC